MPEHLGQSEMSPDEREALIRRIEERRSDPEFMARLRRLMDENREVLDRLKEGGVSRGRSNV